MASTDSLMWEQSKQVSTNLVVKLNGGTTEGTNQFTYNGSTSKSINITASSVGAAASNHTHNYAGSSSAGGNANAAVKLATARTINGVSFNGTANINVPNNYFVVLSDENLNDYKTPALCGEYYAAGGNNVTNTPSAASNHFYLRVFRSANGHFGQLLYSEGIWYSRFYNASTWSSWAELYGSNNKPTASEIGAAASSHNHSASNITSGTLPIARGGTGVTANPSLLVNLGSTSAASVFAASPRPGVTGTLSVAHGGTGATTALAANYNIFNSALTQDFGWNDNTTLAYFSGSPSTTQGAIKKYKSLDMWNDWLQGKVRSVSNLKTLIIMDSYGENYTTTYLNEINATKLWKAGSNFNANDSNSWYNWIGPKLDKLDLKQYGTILIMGGFNDRNASQESIFTGMQKTYTLLKQKIEGDGANVNTFVLAIGHIGWSSTLSSTERDKIVRRSLAAYYKCQKYGFTYMTNIEYTLHSYNLFNSDNVHPNSTGVELIHRQVQQFLKTGTCDVHKDYMTRSITWSNASAAYNVGCILDNEITRIYLPYTTINFKSPIRFYGDTKIQFLQIAHNTASQRGYMMGSFDNQPNVQHQILLNGYFTVSSGPSSFLTFEGMRFVLEGGFLYCYCNMLNLSNNGWIDFYASAMQIRSGQIFLPTLEC